MTRGPLHGVKVVEMGVWVAGPAVTGVMADWGADVIKVEPPTGDPQRAVFGALGVADQQGVPPFEIDNRGKRSVVLDLRQPKDMESMMSLLADADVFVTNVRPAGLARLGLDADALTQKFPRLIYGIITGYGLSGLDVDRAGYDIGAFWSRSGIAHTTVAPNELPPALRSGQGDHTTGLALASGIMAALFDRERTGKGRFVSTSLLRTGMYTLGWDIGVYLRYGKRQSTKTNRANPAPQMNCYRCSDGRAFWLLGLEADRHFPGLLKAIGREDLASVENFKNARARSINAAELEVHDVWWAPLNSIADVVQDPQAIAAGAFVDMTPQPGEAPYRAVNSPVDFSDYSPTYGPVPKLGQHEPKW